MKTVIFLITLLLLEPCTAQIKDSITGSWRLEMGSDHGGGWIDIISFYPDGIFQKQSIWYDKHGKQDTGAVTEGIWTIKDNKISVRHARYYSYAYPPDRRWHRTPNQSYYILQHSDSVIHLSVVNTPNPDGGIYFSRTASQRKFIPEPVRYFYLQNSQNPKRINKVPWHYHRITFYSVPETDSTCTGCCDYYSRHFEGHLRSLKNDTLEFMASSYRVEQKSSFSNAESETDFFITPDSMFLLPLRSSDPDLKVTLFANSQGREVLQGTGNTLMVLGGISTLVAAPLLSYKFNEGTFRLKRYKTYAMIGLISFGVGFPLRVFSRDQHYKINIRPGAALKDEWNLIYR